jgi:hypothetical protein
MKLGLLSKGKNVDRGYDRTVAERDVWTYERKNDKMIGKTT